MILLVIRKGQTDHPSITEVMILVDFDVHDEMKNKFLKFTDSYDSWTNMKIKSYLIDILSDRQLYLHLLLL